MVFFELQLTIVSIHIYNQLKTEYPLVSIFGNKTVFQFLFFIKMSNQWQLYQILKSLT